MAWDDATEWIGFENLPCAKEGVWLIDGKGQVGRMDGGRSTRARKAVEWDEVWRKFRRERERGWGYGGGGGGWYIS